MNTVRIAGAEKICPFQSGQPIAVSGVISGTNAQGVTLTMVPCAREKCMLWGTNKCGAIESETLIVTLANIVIVLGEIKLALQPPLSGSPMMSLVDEVHRLVEILAKRQTIKR
jgi:hypothetical protein